VTTTAFCPYCFSTQPVGEYLVGGERTFRCASCGSPVEVVHPVGKAASAHLPRVLCIDDDRLLLSLFSEALTARGFQTLFATDGPSGIAKAKQERPDLILLDIMMPRMSGFEVCRQLRADPTLKDTPIIILTALEDSNLDLKGRQVGATLSLHKPFGPTDLVSTIQRVLGRNGDSPIL
jgi:DNA-binding response OmpR family regulator